MSFRSKVDKIGRYFSQWNLYRYGLISLIRLPRLKREPPIIVCGAPRSGTTLLISVLGSHPDILAIPYETWLFVNKRPKRWFPWESWNRAFLFLQLKAILISQRIRPGHKRWCEKTPDNILFLDFIEEILHHRVRIIHIIRDGRDVVMSHHDKLGKFMTPKKWVTFVEAGLNRKGQENVFTMKYEDLVGDFDSVMSKVAAFLKIDNSFRKEFFLTTNVTDNPSVISGYGNQGLYVAKPISTNSLYKWKQEKEIQDAFRSYPPAMNLLGKLGYEID